MILGSQRSCNSWLNDKKLEQERRCTYSSRWSSTCERRSEGGSVLKLAVSLLKILSTYSVSLTCRWCHWQTTISRRGLLQKCSGIKRIYLLICRPTSDLGLSRGFIKGSSSPKIRERKVNQTLPEVNSSYLCLVLSCASEEFGELIQQLSQSTISYRKRRWQIYRHILSVDNRSRKAQRFGWFIPSIKESKQKSCEFHVTVTGNFTYPCAGITFVNRGVKIADKSGSDL